MRRMVDMFSEHCSPPLNSPDKSYENSAKMGEDTA